METAKTSKNGEESKGVEYPGSLARVLCIQYPITFRKKSVLMSALFNSDSEVNAIHLTFIQELEFLIRPIDVGA